MKMGTRLSFRSLLQPETLSTRVRAVGLSGLVAIYAILFFTLFAILHSEGLIAFSLLPVAAAGWFFEAGWGALAGLLAIPLNLLLLHFTGQAHWFEHFMQDGLSGSLSLIILGGLFGHISTLRRQLYCQLEASKRKDQVDHEQRLLAEALRVTAEALTSSIGLEKVLDCILTSLEHVVPHDAANIMLVEDGAARIVRSHYYEKFVPSSANIFGVVLFIESMPNFRLAAESHHPIRIADTRRNPQWRDLTTTSWIRSNIIAPIEMEGRLLGFINIDSATPEFFTQNHVEQLQMFAYQAAIALNNARLFADLQASNEDLIHAYDATIAGWAMALDLRDKDTGGHTQRVVDWTLRLARAAAVPEETLGHIRRGAILHDIGKISIPDAILQKPGPLTQEEMQEMRRHPDYALRMLAGIDYLKPVLDIPYCHHERWDGSGYPRRLKGEEIPLAARIFAIIDVWDALTSDRVYRNAWSDDQALAYIAEQAGKHFDPRLVEVFLKMIQEAG